MIIYNEGNTPARQNPLFVDNQPEPPATIAAVISSYTLGNDLLQSYKRGENPTVDFKVYGEFTDRFLPQVIAETKHGDPNHVVIAGGHLDSVPAGPGINDDGSGTRRAADHGPGARQAVEPAAPEGPLHVVRRRGERARRLELLRREPQPGRGGQGRRDARLRHARLGELHPHGLRRRRQRRAGQPGRAARAPARSSRCSTTGSRRTGLQSARTPFDGRSDYVGFTLRGIPAGGVFAGAEGVKTAEEEAIYGGAAGAWYDPCYHQICDDITTVLTGVPPLSADGLQIPFDTDEERQAAANKMVGGALKSFKEMAGAAAYAVWYFSHDPRPVRHQGQAAQVQQARARARSRPRPGSGAIAPATAGTARHAGPPLAVPPGRRRVTAPRQRVAAAGRRVSTSSAPPAPATTTPSCIGASAASRSSRAPSSTSSTM